MLRHAILFRNAPMQGLGRGLGACLALALALPSAAAPVPQEAAAKIERLLEADPEQRAEILAELTRELPVAEVVAGLAEVRLRAAHVLKKGSTLAQLERLAAKRAELDRARSAALELINDEERYFYPYVVPAVSSKRAAQYPAVQGQVAELVEAVEDLWEKPKRYKLSKSFRAGLLEWRWAQSELALRGHKLALSEGLRDGFDGDGDGDGDADAKADWPSWISALDPSVEQLTVRSFAWTLEERLELEASFSARDSNASTWSVLDKDRDFPEARKPSQAEMRQVEVTNDYRAMFGRRALVWSALLQEATHGHSNYMSRWGLLSHYEDKDPERYDLGKRTQLAGYTAASGENCSMGRADPKSAHEGWAGSSGHHRNLLNPRHRAMACAESGGYWTQNFGTQPSDGEGSLSND